MAAMPGALLMQWRLSAAACVALAGAGSLLLAKSLGRTQAASWALGTAAALAYLLWELRRNLRLNIRPRESAVLPTLGAGTTLTLARGFSTALLAGFLCIPEPSGWMAWAPAALYLAAAVADFFDGYAARVCNHATRLGAELDVAFDAFGAMVAVSALVHFGQLPAPFLIVGLAYYLFHGHMKLRARRGRPVLPLRANPHRRMYAGFLFGYFAVALIPTFERSWVLAGGCLFVAPVLLGFLMDWLTTTGALPPEGFCCEPALVRFSYRTAPLILRAVLLAAGGFWLARGLSAEQGWAGILAESHWPAPALLATVLAVTGLAALGMTTAGWLGRLAALMLITLACLDVLLRDSPAALDFWLLCPSVGVLLLGVGRGVLWGPEDALLLTQAGSNRTPSRAQRAAA
jgi:CDP-diacylglycerol--glycerol-3-phosphate 3-phosphatidyltransferase